MSDEPCPICGNTVADVMLADHLRSHVADRFTVVDALTKAAIELGWLPISAESNAKLIMITVRPRA